MAGLADIPPIPISKTRSAGEEWDAPTKITWDPLPIMKAPSSENGALVLAPGLDHGGAEGDDMASEYTKAAPQLILSCDRHDPPQSHPPHPRR